MGPDTEDFKYKTGIVFIDEEQQKHTIWGFEILEKDMPTNDNGVTYLDPSITSNETVTFQTTLAHVGRKQFVRNLQKVGYSKKKAKQIADEMRKNGTSYTRANFLYTICCEPWLDWPKQEVDE